MSDEGIDEVTSCVLGPEAVLGVERVFDHFVQIVLFYLLLENGTKVVAQLDIHRAVLLATLRKWQPAQRHIAKEDLDRFKDIDLITIP